MKLPHIILLAASSGPIACSEQPQKQTFAVVENVAEHADPKWNADQFVVTARSEGGATGSVAVLRTKLICHVGDTIPARQRGIALEIDERTCERQ